MLLCFPSQNRGSVGRPRTATIATLTAILGTAILGAAGQGATPEVFASGLDRPQAAVPIDAGSVLVAERSGRVLLIRRGGRIDLGTIAVPGAGVFYVPEVPFPEGLKDLIAVPGRRDTYLWCATTGGADAVRWTVGRSVIGTATTTRPRMRSEMMWQSDPQPWTRSSPPPFSGCRMAIDGEDVLVAMGANGRGVGSGRVVRVPMFGGAAPVVVSTGHRNPAGIVLLAGRVWEVEHGPTGGDELNVVASGGDYGWPVVSAGRPDDANHRSFVTHRSGMIDPVHTWTPAIAPSGVTTWRAGLVVSTLQGRSLEQVTVGGGTAFRIQSGSSIAVQRSKLCNGPTFASWQGYCPTRGALPWLRTSCPW